MSSRTALDTNILRIRKVFSINPLNSDFIQPLQIPSIGSNGELVWYSTIQLLSSISVPSVSCSVLDILTSVQPGISTISSIQGSALTSSLVSTVEGLGSSEYVSTSFLFEQIGLLSQVFHYISATTLYDCIANLGNLSWIGNNAGPMQYIHSNFSGGYVSTASLTSTTLNIVSTTTGIQANTAGISMLVLQSTTNALGTIGYISTGSLTSTVEGLGTANYISSLLNVSHVSSLNGTFSSIGINTPLNQSNVALDVNGAVQGAVCYSTITAGGTLTISPVGFGIYYNITTTGTFTVALSGTQPASNIGKYNVIRNNTSGSLNIAVTGGTGILSPVYVGSLATVTFLVATTSSYALF